MMVMVVESDPLGSYEYKMTIPNLILYGDTWRLPSQEFISRGEELYTEEPGV